MTHDRLCKRTHAHHRNWMEQIESDFLCLFIHMPNAKGVFNAGLNLLINASV